MALEFCTDSFFFNRQLVQGTSYWLTDFTPTATSYAQSIVLPPWAPRKMYIVEACCGVSGETQFYDLAISIDKGSMEYNAGSDPWHQSVPDFNTGYPYWRNDRLTHVGATVGTKGEESVRFPYPKLLDRDANDRIWVELDLVTPLEFFWFQISWLVQAPTQPLALPTGIAPPMPSNPQGWATRLLNNINSQSSGWGGYTLAMVCEPFALAPGAGSQTRITLSGSSPTKVYIGPRATGTVMTPASMVQMMPSGATAANQWIVNQGIDASNGVVIKAYYASGTLGTSSTANGQRAFYFYGDDAATLLTANYVQSALPAVGLQKIEAFYP